MFFMRFVITKLAKKVDSAILITKKIYKNNIFYVSAEQKPYCERCLLASPLMASCVVTCGFLHPHLCLLSMQGDNSPEHLRAS